jgi:hypothetical protein
MSLDNLQQRLLVDPRSDAVRTMAAQRTDGAMLLARAMKFERSLDEALAIDVPTSLVEQLQAIAATNAVSKSRRWWLAAAVAAGIASTGLFVSYQSLRIELAAHCAEHISHEPYALSRTDAVPSALVTQRFAEHGMQVSNMPILQYLNICDVHGMLGIHAVAQRETGPTTIMVFPKASKVRVGESQVDGNMVRVSLVGDVAIVLLAESSRGFDELEMELRKGLATG